MNLILEVLRKIESDTFSYEARFPRDRPTVGASWRSSGETPFDRPSRFEGFDGFFGSGLVP